MSSVLHDNYCTLEVDRAKPEDKYEKQALLTCIRKITLLIINTSLYLLLGTFLQITMFKSEKSYLTSVPVGLRKALLCPNNMPYR